MSKRVEIIAIGREILRGQTLDTNSHWLARRVTALGAQVGRISVPDDEVGAIAREIRRALEDGAEVVITTGGMGPTFDDKTLEGVAQAFGLTLELNPWALEFVRKRYREFYEQGFVDSPDLTPEREKMARLPRGAVPLSNPVGAAPGVMLQVQGATVFCLPGVPREMRPQFEEEVLPRLRDILGAGVYLEEEVETGLKDESVLAQVVERVMKAVPGVYLKSKPTRFGRDVRLKVVLSAAGTREAEVKERMSRAKALLLKTIS
ncbi:MAG: competence/damage-inducible protein A [Deltaproteobacteria bacterium]|nr:MAG: competence/damage-inducible protein A [Deltaproteobacteria bacterium]HEX16633.1 competence/damage-inducible protein A [Deltaproteobacteria bacterium]